MLLTVDIGNSHTVIGIFANEELVCQWRLQSLRAQTVDELAINLHTLFSLQGLRLEAIEGLCIASVAPLLTKLWRQWSAAFLPERPAPLVVAAPVMHSILPIQTDRPEEVGADRLINALAVWLQYRCQAVVVDFGTAITLDCVSASGVFLGGAILPGIAISLEALSTRTAQLPRIDLSNGPPQVIGANTIDAMKSGILHGYGALVDGLSRKMQVEMSAGGNHPGKVIATGGMAGLIAPYCQTIDETDPLLTLKGLLSYSRLASDHA